MPAQAHVLVVEDNEHVTSALRILLEASDHRVSTAGSIAEALAVAQSDPAALVLLDLTLPDGDGLSLVPALHAVGAGTIVALTGHDDSETRERCLTAGCVDVLVKPVPARDLVKRAGEWLGKA
ncbi:MAG TPA: response regulator [Gemmatimonadaceae bacterium]|nr:response regulator [Gemmatimonadaceae bacterium]